MSSIFLLVTSQLLAQETRVIVLARCERGGFSGLILKAVISPANQSGGEGGMKTSSLDLARQSV